MNGKIFDAASRVLLCGIAVVLLTALAIPELTELGVGEEKVKELWAPMLSMFVVSLLYGFYIRARFRKFGKPGEDYGKWAICTILSLVLGVAAQAALDSESLKLDWLPQTVFVAIVTMGQFAAQEWHLLELERKGVSGESDGD